MGRLRKPDIYKDIVLLGILYQGNSNTSDSVSTWSETVAIFASWLRPDDIDQLNTRLNVGLHLLSYVRPLLIRIRESD